MRIESITIQNFLGLPDFRHTLTHPVLLVAGSNGAGKSSLQDAIRFALTGALARNVKLLKDRSELISEGAAAGFAEVVVDGYQVRRNIGSGSTTKDEAPANPMLPWCLDPTRFAAMPDAERRKMLFEIAGVEVNREVVAEQLANCEGVPQTYIERVLPLLRNGFPEAAKFASEQATQARGAWKSITGENYGSQKAVGWTASAPESAPEPGEIERTQDAASRAEQRVNELTEAKGRASSAISPARRAELVAEAATVPATQAKVAEIETALAEARDAAASLASAAKGNSGTTHACPACEAMLVIDGATLRRAVESPTPPPKAAKEKAKADAIVNGLQQEMSVAKRAEFSAVAAARTLENLPEAAEEDPAIGDKLDQARHDLSQHRAALRLLEDAQRQVDAAYGKTERAAAEHAAVVGWTAVATALSPDGIPSVLLAKALDPVNDALATQASKAGWAPAQITRDLTLTYAGRNYGLCSESERWRADALFAVVIAVASGTRLLALDRFDVLDPAARADAVDFLVDLTSRGDVETVIASGTFKSAPQLDDVDVIWLAGGAISKGER